MSLLNNMLKLTENPFASVADDGTAGDIAGWVDSGSYALNAVISGDMFKGFPGNKIVGIGADSGTGKTYLVLGAAKTFLDDNPEGLVLLFESEGAITKEMLTQRGIDTKRLGVVPVSTVQEFKNQTLKIIDNYEKTKKADRKPLMFILDSLGQLSTDKEMADSLEGKGTRDMTRAQIIKATFRVLTLKMSSAGVPMLVTNHVYDQIGSMFPTKIQSGGTGLVYSSSTILTLSKAREKDSDGVMTGVVITVTASKSRLTKEGSKVKCQIKFDGGLGRYAGLLEIAEAANLFKKVSTRFEMPDGSKVFGKTINENPEKYFTPEIMEKLNEYIKTRFNYGSAGTCDLAGEEGDSEQYVEEE